jgi:uncharacterized surface anchored protein
LADNNGGQYDLQILDKTFSLTVPAKPIIVSSTKTANKDGNLVNWTVSYNITQNNANVKLTDYVFVDDITNAGEYQAGTFRIGNSQTSSDNGTYTPNFTIDANNKNIMSYDLTTTDLDSPVYISYQTKAADEDFFTEDDIILTNYSKLTKDGDVEGSEADFSVTFEKNWISKEGVLDSPEYYISEPTANMIWTINANSLGADIKNVYIIDEFSEHLEVTDAKLYISNGTTFPVSPSKTWTTGSTDTSFFDVATDKFFIGAIVEEKIKLIITTKVKWNAETYDFGHNEYTISNNASIEWEYGDDGTGISTSNGVDIGVGTNPISKSLQVENRDTTNHLINWAVTVSKSNFNNNLRILDLLVYGDTFNAADIDSISTDPVIEATDFRYVSLENLRADINLPLTNSNLNLTPQFGQRYYNDPNNNGVDYDNITVYKLYDGTVAIADLLVITEGGSEINVTDNDSTFRFSTQLTNPNDYASNESPIISNTATLFSLNIKLNSSTRNYKYVSKMLEKDMLKVGDTIAFDAESASASEAFDYIDKSIVFRLKVNSNKLDSNNSYTELTNVILTDTLPEGWDIVDITTGNKFLIYDATGNDVTAASIDETTGFLTGSFVDATDTEHSKAIFEFTDLDEEYIILIKAQLDEDTALQYFDDNTTDSINNLASFEADEVTIAVAGSQSISISSEIISKDYSNETDGELLWSVEYKPFDLEFTGVEIDDVLPIGLDLRTNSLGELDLTDGNFSITKLKLSIDGTYTDDGTVAIVIGDNIKYDNATRTLTFKIPEIGQAYRFNYLTDITANTNVELTNSVTLKNAGGTPTAVLAAYTVAQSDVTATMTRTGWVRITKENDDDETLEGAIFGLYTEDGTTLFRSGTTSSTGELTLRGLPDGNYILKEISAPTDYKKSTKVYTVVVTTLDDVVTTSVNGESNLITFINFKTGDTGNLKVSKKLSGSAPDYSKDFTFTIEIADLNESYDYIGSGGKANGSIEFADGIATFTLKGGESILIQYLPKDLAYTITENDYFANPADRYSTTSVNETGAIVVDDIVYVTFTNQKFALIYDDYGTLPATGDYFPTDLLISFLGISFLGAIVLLLIKKKKFGN